jgi:methyl-accepting chemotaxis protein
MLKKLKSLFVIEDGDAAPGDKSSGADNAQPKKEGSTPAFDVSTDAAGKGAGKVQDKFLEVLFGALESNNQEGFDYMEFKDFLKSLANVPMDDSTRFKSAYATAQTMGATKSKILDSAKYYLTVLASEQSKFQDALQGQRERNLTGKQDEIKQLGNTIDQDQKEIERLTGEIADHKKQIADLEQEITAATEKLSQTADDFNATYKALVNQIQTDIQNIESHL